MHSRSSLSVGQREAAVTWFERGLAAQAVATKLNVSRWPIRRLYQRWQIHGQGALAVQPSKQSYSFEFKLAVVERFLAGESAADLAKTLALSSPGTVRTWVRIHRREGPDGLRPKPKGRPQGSAASAPLSELERLRRENARLKAENAYLGKLRALREQER